jgi:Flp pilus assembly protein TadG
VRQASRRLALDRQGATIIEFAIVAPVMMTLLMGLGDLLYQAYLQSILDGAIQKAGRDSALELNVTNGDALDDKVETMVKNIAKNAEFTSLRRSYSSFALVKPENFTDGNGNGTREVGECYDDVNGNKQWDADPGRASQGGANDVTKYTMSVTYPRIFPVARMFGWSAKAQISATTLLKNQPYKTQTVATIKQVCT